MSGAIRRWLTWRYARAPRILALDAALALILIGFMLFVLAPGFAS